MNQLRTIKQKIEYILNDSEQCRNDDKILYLTYVKQFHRKSVTYSKIKEKFYISFDAFLELPVYSTIKRLRAIIQNKEGKLRPTDTKVLKRRLMQRAEMGAFVKEESLKSQHP